MFSILAGVLLAGGAVIDLHTPRGFSDWALYIIPILLMMRTASRRTLVIVAGAGSILTVAGFFLSPPGAPLWVAAASRLLGLTLLWTTVLVSQRWHHADERVLQANRGLRVLSECNQALVRATDEAELLRQICRVVVEVGGYRMAWVGLAEQDEARTVRPVAYAGCEEGYLSSLNITWADTERGRGPVGTAIRTGQPSISQDISTDERMAPWRAEALKRGYGSCVALPLPLESRTHGALTIYARKANAFDAAEVELLNEMALDLAYGIGALRAKAEHLRAEEALRQSEASLGEAQRIAHVGSWDWDIVRDRAWWSEEMYRLFGLEPQSFVPNLAASLELFHPDDRALVRQAVERTLQTGEPFSLDYRILRNDGSERAVHAQGGVIRDPEGRPRRMVGTLQDITDREQAVNALRESEERYRLLFASNPHPMWVYDLETLRFLEVNDAAVDHYGYSRDEFLAMTLKDIRPPEDIPALLENVARIATGIDRAGVWRHRKKDGTVIDVEIVSHALVWGGRRGELVLANDITERRRAEEALKESEERFRSLVENATVGIYRTTPDGRILMANPALVKMMGCRSFEELASRNLETDGFQPNYPRMEFKRRIEHEGEVRGLEAVWARRDGSLIHVRESARAVPGANGKVQFYDGIVEDISERKQAEEALVKLRQAVDASGEVVFMTDRDGVITFINPEFTRLYGYTEAEVVGKVTPRILKGGNMRPEEYAGFWRRILAKHVVRGSITNKTKDGRLLSVESSVNPILDEQGKVTGFLAIQRDATARKQLEEQLRQAQKIEAVGRLAGGVAHDFNNLLTIINGYAQLLLERVAATDPLRDPLGLIVKAGERAASLTQQLLAFSRKQVMEPRVLDLNSVLEGLEKMVRRLIGEDIDLATVLGKQVGQVKADPTQIEQVILNLVINARDAMPRGGKLTIETANVDLDESYTRTRVDVSPGAYVMLAVSDTGCGMDAETLAHIFEPFFTTKDQSKGTGLGLSTVYGIVKQSGGHIGVYSEVGKGATFKVYLPRLDQAVEAPEVREAESDLAGSETILVVEDEAGVRSLIQSVLERRGYHVLLAGTPEEAVTLSERHAGEIDLLLTDVIMPGFSGKELADHLAFSRPGMRVLFISGYTAEAIAHHGVLDDQTQFLQKPFTPSALLRKVREVINRPGN